MLEHRKNITSKKLAKYDKKCIEMKKKYIEGEQSKIRTKRSRSADEIYLPRWKKDVEEWDELDIDLMDAYQHGFYPYTEDLFNPKPSDLVLISEKRLKWHV